MKPRMAPGGPVPPYHRCDDCGLRHAVKMTKRRLLCGPCDEVRRRTRQARRHGGDASTS